MKKNIILLLSFLLVTFISGYGQIKRTVTTKKRGEIQKDLTVSFKERWAFRTNAVDWFLLTPNIAFEFDLSDSIYNRWTVGGGVKFNDFFNKTDFSSRLVYNVMDFRLEGRRYFKSTHTWAGRYRLNRDGSTKAWWRTYYVGPYIGYEKYSIKLFQNGYVGNMISGGVTAGFNIPLYQCRNSGAIDLDFGLSIGAALVDYEKWKEQPLGGYAIVSTEKRFLPYPILNDIRVAFVYRFKSVRNKYKEFDQEKIKNKQTQRMLQQRAYEDKRQKDSLRNDSILTSKLKLKKLKKDKKRVKNDSIALYK